jgi:hypothetical protein
LRTTQQPVDVKSIGVGCYLGRYPARKPNNAPRQRLTEAKNSVVTPLICEAWMVSVEVKDEYHEYQTALSYS